MTPSVDSFSSVVPVRMSGSGPPLFLIHGVDGAVPDCGALIDAIDAGHPVYGIQSQALDVGAPALTSLEQIAAYHLREIRAAFPHGPYILIGFSFGGMVAFEMARQLIAAGDSPAFLGMIDSSEMSFARRLARADAVEPRASNAMETLRMRLAEARQRPDTLAHLLRKIQARAFRIYYSVASKFGVSIPGSLRQAYHVNWFAAVNYVPGIYAGRITLFKSRDHVWDKRIPADLGWGPWAAGGVRIFEIPGDHTNLFIEPGVGVLGARLSECLAEIRG